MMNSSTSYRPAAALLIVEALLLFAPMAVLGAAIEWPASLDWPAAELLPRLLANEDQVRLGYLLYLAYSLLFWPVALVTTDTAAGGRERGPLLQVALGFAALSALARAIGILRWLTVMPGLAAAYAVGDQITIAAIYAALNSYGGGIGELLGVSLFAAIWLALTVAGIGRLPMSLVGLFSPGARETVEMLYEFERPFVVDASRFVAAFGDIHTPIETGLARTLAWYRAAAAVPAPAH